MPTVTYIDKTKWESSRFDSQLNSAPKPCRNNSQLRTKVERPERPLKNFKSNVRVCWGWGEIGVCFYKKKYTYTWCFRAFGLPLHIRLNKSDSRKVQEIKLVETRAHAQIEDDKLYSNLTISHVTTYYKITACQGMHLSIKILPTNKLIEETIPSHVTISVDLDGIRKQQTKFLLNIAYLTYNRQPNMT